MVITVIAVATRWSIHLRMYKRRRQHQRFGADDGFLLLAFVCAMAGCVCVLRNIDQAYLVEALMLGVPDATLPADFLEQVMHFHRFHAAVVEVLVLAVCAVKFSFLFFFRRLIARQAGHMKAWWWAVLAFTIITTAQTLITIPLWCPHYSSVASTSNAAFFSSPFLPLIILYACRTVITICLSDYTFRHSGLTIF
jgi:hypothetical protein